MARFKLPVGVTITGLDQRTDLQRVYELSRKYQFQVEWGVLFSKSKAGNHPRYPSTTTIDMIRNTRFIRRAAHLCGDFARAVAEYDFARLPDLAGFDRIQVNNKAADPRALATLRSMLPGTPDIIAQAENFDNVCAFDGVWVLYDPSGGKGIEQRSWPDFRGVGEVVGYAGGIGPDNVREVIETIGGHYGQAEYWIDMESGVRTDDWLDLDKCEAVLKAVYG